MGPGEAAAAGTLFIYWAKELAGLGLECQPSPLRAKESGEGGHPGLDVPGHHTLLGLVFLLPQPCACERPAGARLCAKRLVTGSSPIPPRGSGTQMWTWT